MKVPKFMKNEQTPKKSTNVTNTKLLNTFKTLYFTPETNVSQTAKIYNQNSASIKASAKLNVSVNASSTTTTTTTTSRNYTKVVQPKRLKRNRLLVNTKFNCSKNETPVKAYLNAKKQKVKDDDYYENEYDTPTRITITATQSPINTISKTKSFSSRSPLSVLSTQLTPCDESNKLKNFVKNSFSNLHKFMNKSKTRLGGSKSNSCSPSSASITSTSSDEASSPEIFTPQNIAIKYPRTTTALANNNYNNKNRRPIMGITALMLNNYKQNTSTAAVTSGFTTTFPNVYLLGVPIVFNNTTINAKVEVKRTSASNIVKPTRKTRSSTSKRRSNVDSNNNTFDTNNGFKLEIYGENVNESIRI